MEDDDKTVAFKITADASEAIEQLERVNELLENINKNYKEFLYLMGGNIDWIPGDK